MMTAAPWVDGKVVWTAVPWVDGKVVMTDASSAGHWVALSVETKVAHVVESLV